MKNVAQAFCAATALVTATVPAACGGVDPADLALEAPGLEQDAIINGETCDADQSATAVAILVEATVDFSGFGQQEMRTVVCTGTLIAPDTVLTAAHCLDATALTFGFGEVLDERYYISFEEDLTYMAEQGQGGQGGGALPPLPADAAEASDWVIHPNFNLETMNGQNVNGPGNFHDVGLLFLQERVTDREPEVVITPEEAAQLDEGAEVYIAGWGQQTQTSGPFEPPPAGTVGKKVCAETFVNEVGTHEMQIGADASTSRKCHGDSGGPTFMDIETNHVRTRRVVGITSHAYDAEDCNKGGVDTRVDAWHDWIDSEMTEACAKDARAWCEVEGVIHPSFFDPPAVDDDDDNDDGLVPPGADLLGGCSHVGSGDGEGSEPTRWGALALLGLLILRRRRR